MAILPFVACAPQGRLSRAFGAPLGMTMWLSRIWNALCGNRLSRELDREMAFHLAEREDDLVASGMAPDVAAREARRRFGNYGALKERTHDVDVAAWLDTFAADVRYALRALRASPGFATVAILSLTLGIGANSAIFTLINAVMLQAIPVTRPNELVSISRDGRSLTHPMWAEISARQTVFSGVFAYTSVGVDLSNGGESHSIPVGLATDGFFATLGVSTALGRPLTPDDDRAASCQHVAVVSDDFWRTELGAAPNFAGRTITLDGKPFQVVGVTPPSFFGVEIGYHIPVWAPMCSEQILRGESGNKSRLARMIIGRMKPGVTLAGVNAQLAALRPAILEATVQYSAPKSGILLSPNEYRKTQFTATSFTNGDPALRNTYGDALIALMGVVGVVLLIACANVANLLLARATTRQREIAVRLALGASRTRLLRQLLTESTVLATVGALGGGVFAWWGSRLLVSLLTTSAQRVAIHLTPDWQVVAFTAAIAVGTGLLFGLAPAWRSARVNAGATMRPTGRGVIEGRSKFGVGKLLVAGQIALSLVAVTAAGLLLSSWLRLATIDPGYNTDSILVVGARQGGTTQYREILDRVRGLPGVTGAAYSAYTPLSDAWNTTINVDGANDSKNAPVVRMNDVTEDYFAALGTPLLAGRDFGPQDTPTSSRVAIVSENLAREFLGDRAALGKRVRFGSPPGEPVEIVGIVGDTKQTALRDEKDPVVYFPFSQDTSAQRTVSFAIHTTGAPATLTSAVKETFAAVDTRISYRVTTLARRIESAIRLPKTLGVLAAFFGGLALLLAAIGLYGIMAYSVARRRSEIGIRVALGAERGRIVRLVLGDVGRIVATGVVTGVGLALATTRVGQSLLYDVAPNDPLVLGAAAGLLAAVAVVAGAIPARRAAKLDPMIALRVD